MDLICFLFVYVHFPLDLLYEMYIRLHCYFVLSPFPCKDPLNINSVKILHTDTYCLWCQPLWSIS